MDQRAGEAAVTLALKLWDTVSRLFLGFNSKADVSLARSQLDFGGFSRFVWLHSDPGEQSNQG